MSNSIWHKAGFHEAIDNKLKASKDGKWIYWTMYGWNIAGEDVHDIGVEWAYLEDIIAQADKAERLQKQLNGQKAFSEALWVVWTQAKQDLERLQKALCFIRNIRGAGMSYQDMFLDAHEVAKTALDPEYKPVLCGRYDEEMLGEIQQLTGAGK